MSLPSARPQIATCIKLIYNVLGWKCDFQSRSEICRYEIKKDILVMFERFLEV